jgi:hypothetical protein
MMVQQQHSCNDDGDEGEKINMPASVATAQCRNAGSRVSPDLPVAPSQPASEVRATGYRFLPDSESKNALLDLVI